MYITVYDKIKEKKSASLIGNLQIWKSSKRRKKEIECIAQ